MDGSLKFLPILLFSRSRYWFDKYLCAVGIPPADAARFPAWRSPVMAFRDQDALDYHSQGRPGQDRGRSHQALPDGARPVAGLHAGRGDPLPGDREESRRRLQVHQQGQPGGRVLERHRGAGPRRHRRPGRQAGDGRQGRPVQALRPRRRVRHRSWTSHDPDEIIKCCKMLEPTFGGINLEDIKAPECFYIEETPARRR